MILTAWTLSSGRRLGGILSAVLLLGGCQWGQASPPSGVSRQRSPSLTATIHLSERWIVSAREAEQLIRQGALVWDANGRTRGAVSVTWQQFSQPRTPDRGKLLEDDLTLTQELRSLGLSQNQPVLVAGNPRRAWGEEGRIVWMLRSLGHQDAYMVDGGRAVLPSLTKRSAFTLCGFDCRD